VSQETKVLTLTLNSTGLFEILQTAQDSLQESEVDKDQDGTQK
jgi:hypothetical protein